MQKGIFSAKIIEWYQSNQRPLPWRQTTDPYKIWLSEVILQQTRVAQGLPYYEQFIRSFPTIFDLAGASEQGVLRLWQGLGYYSRARNLHQCAKQVVKCYNGKFPNTLKELTQLPGIGPYTAAAIASIAYREPIAVVDGNVFRVLARHFALDTDISSNGGKKHFTALANRLMDKSRPDLFNQALMEFGALHCLPKNPKCHNCIFSKSCEAKQKDLQSLLPVKSKKAAVRTRYFYYFIIRHKGKTLMKLRRGKDIWRGLHDFYLMESTRKQRTDLFLKRDQLLDHCKVLAESKVYKHLLTHQKLWVKFISVQLKKTKLHAGLLPRLGLKWLTRGQIEELPKPILIERFLRQEIDEREFW